MSESLTAEEIEAVFVALDLPLIERGIDEIRRAKDEFRGPLDAPEHGTVVQRLTVSNRTGKVAGGNENAELERSSW